VPPETYAALMKIVETGGSVGSWVSRNVASDFPFVKLEPNAS
jgi:hypothetical protein